MKNENSISHEERNIKLFYLSSLMAYLGSTMFNYTIVIHSRFLMNSDSSKGLLYLVIFAPLFIFGFFAGVFVDGHSRKKLLLGGQFICIVANLFCAYLISQSLLTKESIYILYIVSFINGIAMAWMPSARMAIIGNIASVEKIGKLSITVNIMYVLAMGLGPLFIGLLKQYNNWEELYLTIGMVYLFSNVALLFINIQKTQISNNERHYLKELSDVLVYLKKDKLISQLLFVAAIATFLLGPFHVNLPEYSRSMLLFNESERGLLMAFFAFCILIGGALALALNKYKYRGKIIFGSILFSGSIAFFLPNGNDVLSAFVIIGISSMLGGIPLNMVTAGIQTNIDNKIRGRIMGFYVQVNMGVTAIVGAISAILADYISIADIFKLLSVILSIMVVIGWALLSNFRNYE